MKENDLFYQSMNEKEMNKNEIYLMLFHLKKNGSKEEERSTIWAQIHKK